MSIGRFAEANLSTRVGDAAAAVRHNRERLLGTLGLDAHELVTTRQVHGARVVRIGMSGPVRPASCVEADGMVTTESGIALLIGVADCLPVVLVGRGVVGVLHVGWKGLVRGIVESGVEAMLEVGGTVGGLRAHLGPGIGPCHFPVGEEVLRRVEQRYTAAAATTTAGAPAVDVAAAVREALAGHGVVDIVGSGTCTFESGEHFSARRDGPTGCQGAVVALR
jgi:hypothetical protein